MEKIKVYKVDDFVEFKEEDIGGTITKALEDDYYLVNLSGYPYERCHFDEFKPTKRRLLERIVIDYQSNDRELGWYYISDDELIYVETNSTGTKDEVQVSDLTDLKVWEYNNLVDSIKEYHPNFKIEKLEGRYVWVKWNFWKE